MGRTSTRRTLVRGASFLLGLALNAVLLALIARFDTTVRQDPPRIPEVVPIDLSQLVPPPPASPIIRRKPSPSIPTQKAQGPEAPQTGPARRLSSAPEPAAPAAPPSTQPPSAASPTQGGAPDDATRARVSEALQGLTGCSMISGPDDEATREQCSRAFTKADVAGVAIDTVPEDKRVAYDGPATKADNRRNALADMAVPKAGGAGGMGRDKGRNINVHYGCWMKVGPNATPKLHYPGVM